MAGSSYTVTSKVRYQHITTMRNAGLSVEVHFDASHPAAVKPPHFELNITVHDRMALATLDYDLVRMFAFFTREVNLANRIKYEVANYDEDLIDRADKSYQIRAELAKLDNGGAAGFVDTVF